MSKNRRRMMMQMESDPIPRERLVFSNAGDVILTGCTKISDGDAICGLALIELPNSSTTWMYLILMTKNGRNDNAIKSTYSSNNYQQFKGSDGLVHSISCTVARCSGFTTIDEIKAINVNKLPIMNEITGKNYKATNQSYAYAAYESFEACRDLLDYYYGVI